MLQEVAAWFSSGDVEAISPLSEEYATPLEMRVEYTRLFCAAPAVVHLHGSRYKAAPGQTASGEQHAVARRYREVGLKVGDTREQADHIALEMEFMSYVRLMEAHAWEDDDSEEALEWRALARSFFAEHLCSFAIGLSEAMLARAELQFYRLAGRVLGDVARSQAREFERRE